MSSVVTSPTNRHKYFVGAASGGVWRTVSGGFTWTPLTDDMPACAIGALAMDPADEQVIYAGTGEANFANHSYYGLGIYKTEDGGDSWSILASEVFGGRTFSRLIVSPADSQVVYAAVMHAGGFPAHNAAKGHPGTDGAVGVFASGDGGETWNHLTNGLPAVGASDLVIDPADPLVLYAAIGDIFGEPGNGIYKTEDGGASWDKLEGGLPTNIGRISVAIAPSDNQRLYALIANPSDAQGGSASTENIYRSDDAGATWTPTNPGSGLQATYAWYLSVLLVDRLDPDTVYAGGVNLIKTTNGGDTYVDITPPHVDIHALAQDLSNRLVCCDDGGVHVTSNGGITWYAVNDGMGTLQFYPGLSLHPTDRDFVLGGTQDNGTCERFGTGLLWSQQLGGDGGFTAMHPDDPDVRFAELQGTGNLYRSTNGSAYALSNTGINSDDRNCFLPPIVFAPGDPHTLLYGTHRIYRSTSAGNTWTPISDDLTGGAPAAIRCIVFAPSDDQVVYAATNDGRVLVSENGGADWTLSLVDIPGWPRTTREIAVHPQDPSTAYLAVARFGVDQVMTTSDRGQSWQSIDGDLPDTPANSIAAHAGGGFPIVFVGTDLGVYMTCNSGTNWRKVGTGLPHTPVIDLIVDTNFDRLVAGTMGRGTWSIPLPLPGDHDDDGDTDLMDVAALQTCFSGDWTSPGYLLPDEDCLLLFDLDFDDDVDLLDYQCVTPRVAGPAAP